MVQTIILNESPLRRKLSSVTNFWMKGKLKNLMSLKKSMEHHIFLPYWKR